MHDRRVNGKALTFGNFGALFMNAMTWWDHETLSIWSQPWGSAIDGELKDTALTLIPASIVPWPTWLQQHPETTVVADDLGRKLLAPGNTIIDEFVVGVALADAAKAYDFRLASEKRVINDRIGEHPVAVFVSPDTRDIKVYLRGSVVDDSDGAASSELLFGEDDRRRIVDLETGSVWDIALGLAIDGPLKGTLLQQVPYVTSYEWAWRDFFPHTTFYQD